MPVRAYLESQISIEQVKSSGKQSENQSLTRSDRDDDFRFPPLPLATGSSGIRQCLSAMFKIEMAPAFRLFYTLNQNTLISK